MNLKELAVEVEKEAGKVDTTCDPCQTGANTPQYGPQSKSWPEVKPKATLSFPPSRRQQEQAGITIAHPALQIAHPLRRLLTPAGEVQVSIMNILEEHKKNERKLVVVENQDGEASYAFLGADGHLGAVED